MPYFYRNGTLTHWSYDIYDTDDSDNEYYSSSEEEDEDMNLYACPEDEELKNNNSSIPVSDKRRSKSCFKRTKRILGITILIPLIGLITLIITGNTTLLPVLSLSFFNKWVSTKSFSLKTTQRYNQLSEVSFIIILLF